MEFVGFDVVMSDIQELFKTIFTTYKGASVLFFCIFINFLIIFLNNYNEDIGFILGLLIFTSITIFIMLIILVWFNINNNSIVLVLQIISGILMFILLIMFIYYLKVSNDHYNNIYNYNNCDLRKICRRY